jgi:glycosyltransferase involved in cell wall biosynthesis
VTLVGHEIDPDLRSKAAKAVSIPRPLGSAFLGERVLERAAVREKARLPADTVFVGNAGNCPDANVSWVHFVHAAWPGELEDPPLRVRASHRLRKLDALHRERRALDSARVVVANSERTKTDLIRLLGVAASKIHSIYFGADRDGALAPQRGPTSHERAILFVGALGWDRRKGLDIALRAFAELSGRGGFDRRFVVAGGGTTAPWESLAADLGISERVRFVNFVDRVPQLMSQADLLISPSRYESYGLAIQESFCAGLPALVLANRTGFMERLGAAADEFSVQNEDPSSWAMRIEQALANLPALRERARVLGEQILARSWDAFARDFIEVAESGAT